MTRGPKHYSPFDRTDLSPFDRTTTAISWLACGFQDTSTATGWICHHAKDTTNKELCQLAVIYCFLLAPDFLASNPVTGTRVP